LEKPLQLRVHAQGPHYYGPLALLAGPQRLETGWLQGTPALRDYFVARSERAGLLWIYRERLSRASPQWYLHGLFA
jgi:protein ImuB